MAELKRREMLKAFALAGGATVAGGAIWWKGADFASAVEAGVGPYGDLLAADAKTGRPASPTRSPGRSGRRRSPWWTPRRRRASLRPSRGRTSR